MDTDTLEVSKLGPIRKVAQKIFRTKAKPILAGGRCSWVLCTPHKKARDVCRRDERVTLHMCTSLLLSAFCLTDTVCHLFHLHCGQRGWCFRGCNVAQSYSRPVCPGVNVFRNVPIIIVLLCSERSSNATRIFLTRTGRGLVTDRVIVGYTRELQMKVTLLGMERSFVLLHCRFL
jgi:hypothetical protein